MATAIDFSANRSPSGFRPSRRAVIAGLGLAAGATCGGGAFAATAFPVVGKVERLDPALDALIDADARVEQVFDGFVWSEGPLWVGGADGYLLVSDPRANLIYRWNESDGRSEWLRPSGYQGAPDPRLAEPGSNGLCLGRGGIVCADSGSRAISLIDIKTRRKRMLCTHFEGKRFNSPNDVIVGADGAVYFSDPPFGLRGIRKSPDREMDFTGLFRLGPDNAVTLIDRTIFPNGVGLSPDGRTLYATDRSGWLAWTLDPNGRPLERRTLIGRETGIQGGDGLSIDSRGNIWASSRDGISIFTPEGQRIGIIRADDVISNCEFAADGHLYMTSNHRVLRVRVKAKKLMA
jgi:gluconolactonase